MKKCEVLVDRVSLTVGKGSIVMVEDKQYEVARQFLKPLDKVVKEEPKEDVEDEIKEEKPKKKKK